MTRDQWDAIREYVGSAIVLALIVTCLYAATFFLAASVEPVR